MAELVRTVVRVPRKKDIRCYPVKSFIVEADFQDKVAIGVSLDQCKRKSILRAGS